MSVQTKISIVVPVYKSENYISRCIKSVIAQTFTEWELILVDDGGKDNSMNLVKKYAKSDNRIKFIESEMNCGPMVAREKGYLASNGSYIAFMDSDDTLPINALEILYQTMENTSADIILGATLVLEVDGTTHPHKKGLRPGIYSKKEVLSQLMNGIFPHNLWGKLFKADLLRNNNMLNSIIGCTNGEDGLLFYQVLESVEKVVIIDEFVYHYWMNDGSSTHRKLTGNIIDGMARLDGCKLEIFNKAFDTIEDNYYHSLYTHISNIAMGYPIKDIRKIYLKYGVKLDLTIKSLKKYFFGIELYKVFIKIHIYYKFKSFFNILRNNKGE